MNGSNYWINSANVSQLNQFINLSWDFWSPTSFSCKESYDSDRSWRRKNVSKYLNISVHGLSESGDYLRTWNISVCSLVITGGEHADLQRSVNTSNSHPLLLRGERMLLQADVLLLEALQPHLEDTQEHIWIRITSGSDTSGSESAEFLHLIVSAARPQLNANISMLTVSSAHVPFCTCIDDPVSQRRSTQTSLFNITNYLIDHLTAATHFLLCRLGGVSS